MFATGDVRSPTLAEPRDLIPERTGSAELAKESSSCCHWWTWDRRGGGGEGGPSKEVRPVVRFDLLVES
jgi:hypothetical protein